MQPLILPTGNALLELKKELYIRNGKEANRHRTLTENAIASLVPSFLMIGNKPYFLNVSKSTEIKFHYDRMSSGSEASNWHGLDRAEADVFLRNMLRSIDIERRILHGRHDGYECSSRGDIRFSALQARMSDGRTIEMHYQCDAKGYDIGGRQWLMGKGRPPLVGKSREQLWDDYYALWAEWCNNHKPWVYELHYLAAICDYTLSDMFSGGVINQARALGQYITDNPWDCESNLF